MVRVLPHLVIWGLLGIATAYTEYGLTGLPANSYDPVCGIVCLRSFYVVTLACSTGGETIGMVTLATATECYAEDTAFSTSVAWSTHVKCRDARPSADPLKYWWDMQITGQKTAGARTVPVK